MGAPCALNIMSEEVISNRRNITKNPTNQSKSFPQKLHDMMEYVEEQQTQPGGGGNLHVNTISWVLGGRGIQIHDREGIAQLLPLFFAGQSKFNSFRRQLNMWDFERVKHGPHKGAFLHPYFVKGDRALADKMSRQIAAPKIQRRKSSSPPPPSRKTSSSPPAAPTASYHRKTEFTNHGQQQVSDGAGSSSFMSDLKVAQTCGVDDGLYFLDGDFVGKLNQLGSSMAANDSLSTPEERKIPLSYDNIRTTPVRNKPMDSFLYESSDVTLPRNESQQWLSSFGFQGKEVVDMQTPPVDESIFSSPSSTSSTSSSHNNNDDLMSWFAGRSFFMVAQEPTKDENSMSTNNESG